MLGVEDELLTKLHTSARARKVVAREGSPEDSLSFTGLRWPLGMGGNQSSEGANQVWSLTCNDFCRADRASRPTSYSPSSGSHPNHPGTSTIDRHELQKKLLENLAAANQVQEYEQVDNRPVYQGKTILQQKKKLENLSEANENIDLSSDGSQEDYRGLWQVRTEWTVNVRDQPKYNAQVVNKFTGGQVFQVDGQYFDHETGVQWLRLPNDSGFVARRHKDGSLLVTQISSASSPTSKSAALSPSCQTSLEGGRDLDRKDTPKLMVVQRSLLSSSSEMSFAGVALSMLECFGAKNSTVHSNFAIRFHRLKFSQKLCGTSVEDLSGGAVRQDGCLRSRQPCRMEGTGTAHSTSRHRRTCSRRMTHCDVS
eukprot:746504-Hanusia_phi.AAC.6